MTTAGRSSARYTRQPAYDTDTSTAWHDTRTGAITWSLPGIDLGPPAPSFTYHCTHCSATRTSFLAYQAGSPHDHCPGGAGLWYREQEQTV